MLERTFTLLLLMRSPLDPLSRQHSILAAAFGGEIIHLFLAYDGCACGHVLHDGPEIERVGVIAF